MKFDRKPSTYSLMKIRTHHALLPTNTSTPLGSLMKIQMKESEIRPEYNSIFYELRALPGKLGSLSSKNVEFENYTINGGKNYRNIEESQTMIERGRLYEQYSARRNERLRMKQEDPKPVYYPGLWFKFESGKKMNSSPSSPSSGNRTQHLRYALRSMAKRPPHPLPINVEEKMARKTNASGSRRI
ncbi:LOW QUALITY PROTEIN: hypothetical protein Cgig2_012756 [Carnegiea gigantea]|uniref:Uncharacterized protein n=1 Tax=Carnegiea gigantea TaxID=171969 RepID=A0A9Q1KCB2_9CARY|nr:LOW QUALITY PROTEIN: hypothetical protein Cgig2_012756 [Carnegiea gigantea]